jgi:hypothetical protein
MLSPCLNRREYDRNNPWMTVSLDVPCAVDPILVLPTDRLPASHGVRRLSIFDIIFDRHPIHRTHKWISSFS